MRVKILIGAVVLAAVTVFGAAGTAQAAPGANTAGVTGTSVGAPQGQPVAEAAATRVTSGAPAGAQPGGTSAQFVTCWNAYLGWEYFAGWRGYYHVTCNSDQVYRPWVHCTNGVWYYGSWYVGGWDLKLYCPVGVTADAGFVEY
ncbi:hypothetical protein AB0M43_02205 [Longispora sp. NPDC051575]|uniref:hypothetical protein n=1 Tax=Longispora sp. NPDC051575 TaxID=3154943 RepID=UPI0034224B82